MDAIKTLGIWMDHSTADLIDMDTENSSSSITSKFTNNTKVEAMHKSENLMHNKEQQMQEAFYKKIADEILKYDHVLLFGPTNAKAELHNYLNEDLHFKDKRIDIESTDKMLDHEKKAFVKRYFNMHA
ncbi:hypothetical protein [Aurantibacillus circumpalustris]|uniref:hypothetical protein n=1 Tax=Aurantibacillus circumpalustris TaxID=3036359 RepID=UPI00295A8B28|nr:hypothetical protein [Aurantibacillus circumpalustris]